MEDLDGLRTGPSSVVSVAKLFLRPSSPESRREDRVGTLSGMTNLDNPSQNEAVHSSTRVYTYVLGMAGATCLSGCLSKGVLSTLHSVLNPTVVKSAAETEVIAPPRP